jgi:hypothetical protein
MKRPLSILFAALMASVLCHAQMIPTAKIAEMKKLDFMIGDWKGGGWIEFSPGQRFNFTGTETIRYKLGGSVILVEGRHKAKFAGSDVERTVHEAMGILSYDESAKHYRFNTYLATGGGTNAEARLVSDSVVEWRFYDTGRKVDVRFTIRLNEKGEWFEIGEASLDGTTWHKFFEMTLERLK